MVPKRREDGRPSPRTLCFSPIVFETLSFGGTSRDILGTRVLLINPALKLLVDILVVGGQHNPGTGGAKPSVQGFLFRLWGWYE